MKVIDKLSRVNIPKETEKYLNQVDVLNKKGKVYKEKMGILDR